MTDGYKRIFIVNSLTGWAGKIFQIAFALVLTPLLLAGLGAEKYGAWVLVGQFAAYLMMLDLGVSSSIARYYARHMASSDALSNKQLYSTARFILTIVGFLIVLISWFIRNYLGDFYRIEASIGADFAVAVVLSGFCLAVTLPFYVFPGILQAYHKLYYVDLSIFVSSVVNFLGVLGFYYFGRFSLTSLSLVLLVSEVAKYALMSVLAKRLAMPTAEFSFEHVSWDMTKRIYSLGIASFLAGLLKVVRQQVPITLVGRVFGLAVVPVISIPLAALTHIGALLGRVGTIFTALASELDAVRREDRIESLNFEIARLLLSVTFAGALLIIYFSFPILSLWLRNTVDKDSLALLSRCLSIMVVPYFIFVSLTGVNNTLMATGRHFRVVLANAAITAGCFCLFFVATDRVVHVAHVISITFFASSLYLVYQFSCYLGKSFRHTFTNIFGRPLCFASLLAVSFWPVRKLLSSEWLGILLFCVMAILFLALTIEQKHRRLVLKTLGLAYDAQDNLEIT